MGCGLPLKKTSEEILQSLIASHRYLRDLNSRSLKELREEVENIREQTIKSTREKVTDGEYISIEKLKTLSILEISEYLKN